MKKLVALLLAVVMVASLFAGCGSSDVQETQAQETQSAGETAGETASSTDEVVTLKWVQVGSGMPANYDAWKANLDAYLEEKIGVHLEMEIVGWGDWDTRRNMIVSTNEPYDIMFTNNGTFYNDVSIGAFADITDLIQTAAPDLYEFIPESYWDACKVGGKLYAVPAYKDSSITQYFVYDKEKVEATGLDYASAHTLQDVTPIVAKMYEQSGEAVFILNQGGLDAIYGAKYDDLSSGLPALGVSYAGGEAKVVSVFEQEDVLADLETLRSWYEAGYINSDAAILSEAPSYRPCFVAQGWSAAADTTWGPQMGVDAVAIKWGDTVLSNSSVQGSMSCISASCQYPEKALQLLELVNTDSYVRDALYYGLEGDNFDYVDGKVHKNNTDWTMAGYTQGTFFNVTTLDTDEFNQWDEVKALNEAATPSPLLGFSFDTAPVADELAACIAIYTEYRPMLMTGTGDPAETIATMMDAMRASGFDDVLAEAQSQIDAWKG